MEMKKNILQIYIIYRKDINMVKEIKATISRKDLYSKQYYNLKIDIKGDDIKMSTRRGLVEILLKLAREIS